MARPNKPIEYVVTENGCHICTSHYLDKNGYPIYSKDGFTKMHRWLFWKATGEKPEVVMHTCNNPSCINIEHLKGGDQKSNMQHMAISGNCKDQILTPQQALEILHDKRPYKLIAADYGVSVTNISMIKTGRSWKHLVKIENQK